MLIVGSRDEPVIELSRLARKRLAVESELVIVPDAGHLFQEAGALDEVVKHAARWFLAHFVRARREPDL